ncbi:LysM peptidoglycan-binding domain-containing protein [Ruficoccus amylovorans]|uniref:LysM peptidoglycan-binding domain-containing protein n=1 Tax=Ruficoccus amylovorans TaxID=1804625 RepID=A0A842HCZ0_9BACT|nr:LysM domain-containing protein [Ruficoccus amylovorans]MBC2593566.1 LysM peptidoglycan-binding domain-containing protein [Ruficoccus amylovorans]
MGQTRVTLADVYQQVEQLQAQVGRLRLDMEALQRENDSLRKALEAQTRQQSALVTQCNQISAQVNAQQGAWASRETALKKEIYAEMTRQMKDLASQTQQGFDQLTKARSYSQQNQTTSFDQDYPQTGISYVVKSGDSLWKIARDNNSSVRDIQNANQITNPGDLKVGQTIFVPQRNP